MLELKTTSNSQHIGWKLLHELKSLNNHEIWVTHMFLPRLEVADSKAMSRISKCGYNADGESLWKNNA